MLLLTFFKAIDRKKMKIFEMSVKTKSMNYGHEEGEEFHVNSTGNTCNTIITEKNLKPKEREVHLGKDICCPPNKQGQNRNSLHLITIKAQSVQNRLKRVS